MTMQTFPRRLGAAVVTAVIVWFLSVRLDTFRDYQIAEVAVYVPAVAGLTVLTGLSGQISLGNGAFMAIGGYTTALLLLHLNWPFIAALVVSGAVAAAAGGIVGVAAARLRGPYLAGATLILGVALPTLATAYAGVFGGDQGLNVTFTAPAFLGAAFPLTRWQAWVSAVVALVTLVLLANLCYSRIGRNWRAVRDDEVAAALNGVNVAVTRILAFVVSAVCAGLAGSLLAIVTSLVAPGAFTLTLSIALLTAAVIGGLGSLPGALWGSLLIVLVPTYVTDVATSHGLSSSVGSNIPIAAYGVVLILVMLVFPQGIQGGLRRLLALFTGPDPAVLDAADVELGNYHIAMVRHGLKTEMEGGGSGVAEHAAAPYLLRQGRWDEASLLLERMIQRDKSPDSLAFALPLLRRIVEATAGTERELVDAGILARTLRLAGRTAEAEPMLRDVIARRRPGQLPGGVGHRQRSVQPAPRQRPPGGGAKSGRGEGRLHEAGRAGAVDATGRRGEAPAGAGRHGPL